MYVYIVFCCWIIHNPTHCVKVYIYSYSELWQQSGISGRSAYLSPVKGLKCKAFLPTWVSQRSDYYYFPWLRLCAFRSWRRYAGARRRGYGSLVPNSRSFAVSWRRCTASRHGSSARPARNSWSWRHVWSSSDNRPAPVSQGHNPSKRPTTLHRYGLLGQNMHAEGRYWHLKQPECIKYTALT